MTPDLDRELGGIAQGDADAFARWMAGAEPAVRGALRSFAAVVDTEAVLQEALLRIWQVAPRFVPDGRPNALLRFAVRAARNLAVSQARRARLDSPDPDEEHVLSPRPPDPLLRRAIEECRGKLPRKPALALSARLTSVGGEPDEALAARLGMTRNTFLQNFTRARRLLTECLQRLGVDLRLELA